MRVLSRVAGVLRREDGGVEQGGWGIEQGGRMGVFSREDEGVWMLSSEEGVWGVEQGRLENVVLWLKYVILFLQITLTGGKAPMQVDGEPWEQNAAEFTVTLNNRVTMLANHSWHEAQSWHHSTL